jgi:hypothetical protein
LRSVSHFENAVLESERAREYLFLTRAERAFSFFKSLSLCVSGKRDLIRIEGEGTRWRCSTRIAAPRARK